MSSVDTPYRPRHHIGRSARDLAAELTRLAAATRLRTAAPRGPRAPLHGTGAVLVGGVGWYGGRRRLALLRTARSAYHGRMDIRRRDFLLAAAGAAAAAALGAPAGARPRERREMYGLIGKMTAVPGQRDALIAILLDGVAGMPGCLSYVVARDPADADAVWITEVWDSKASHDASLSLPAVRQAIARGKSLITGVGDRVVTMPVGGHGLAPGAAR